MLLTELLRGSNSAYKTAHKLLGSCKKQSKRASRMLKAQREDVVIMKKSTVIAWVAFFSAVAGALAAAYFYIQRREKELDEYEQLLFSEDFCDEAPEDFEAEFDADSTIGEE